MELDFSQPAPQAKTLEEAQEIINVLWSVLGELSKRVEAQSKRIEELEERLRTNSKNSSKPASADGIGRKKKDKRKKSKSGRKAGGQAGHEGKGRELLPPEETDRVEMCYPPEQCECGHEVERGGLYRRHQVHELPEVKPVVTEYRLITGTCVECGKVHMASLPAGVSNCFLGPRAVALVGTLTGAYRLSKRLVQELLHDVCGLKLSVGAISQTEELVSCALECVAEEAKTYVREAPIVHCDETGHKEKGEKQWMWIAIAGLVCVFLARTSRGAVVAKELLGEAFAGFLISDRWSAYNWIDVARRQLCWAHLIRDFTKISERSGKAGQLGDHLLHLTEKKMFRYWHSVKDGTLSRALFVKRMQSIRADVERTLAEGRVCGESKTQNTCKKLLAVKAGLWTFIDHEGIEPTNNLGEQMIRHYVIWRKICFGAQSERGSLYIERVMTVVGSCRLQRRNILDFMTQAVDAFMGKGTIPSLLPIQPLPFQTAM